MVYLPVANVIITGHENSDLKMWSLECQQEAPLKTVSGQSVHDNTISALVSANVTANTDDVQRINTSALGTDTSAGFETLIAGSYDRQLSVWRVTLTSDGTAMAKFERTFCAHDDPEDEILAVAYCPATSSIFTGGNAGIIRKWAYWGVKQLEAELLGHEEAVTCFAVDGNFLYSGSGDHTVRIWESSQGYELKVIRVHDVTVQALLVVPDSGYVVSCAGDGRVVFWNPRIGLDDVEIIRTHEQPEEFRALAFVDLSRTVMAGCESGKIIAFPLPDDSACTDSEPKVLQGVETPQSMRRGEGYTTLDAMRRVREPG